MRGLSVLRLLCLFAFLCTGFAFAQQGDCTRDVIAPSGEIYNIASLSGQQINTGGTKPTYSISLCSNAFSNCGLCPVSGYCEHDEWFDNCIGSFASVVGMANGAGVELLYPAGEFGKSGSVRLLCTPGGPDLGTPTFSSAGLKQICTIPSGLACPGSGTGGRVSPGGVILIILLIAIILYLAGGAAYLRYRVGVEPGVQMIPNVDFWVLLPGLILDGASFALSGVKSGIARCRGQSS